MTPEKYVTPVLRPIAPEDRDLINTYSDYLVSIQDRLYVGKFEYSEYAGWRFLGHDEFRESGQRGTFLRSEGTVQAIWQVIR